MMSSRTDRPRRQAVRGGLLLVAVALSLAACGKGNGDTKTTGADAGVPVEAVAVGRRAISASYTGVATLEPDSEAQVAAKISGNLVKLFVEEGDQVRAGQLLAKLEDESPRLNLAKTEATMRKLENDFRRSSEMFARNLLSVEQNDKIRYDLETQRASFELARLELSYTSITAPIDGVISRRMAKVGNFIQVNQALFQIDNFDPLLAVLSVPERELGTLRVGQAVGMHVDSIPDHRFDGLIQRISPVVDPATGTFRVTCEFRDRSGRLKSGMFGRLDIAYARHDDALVVPRGALIEEDGETAVFVVTAGSAATPARDAKTPSAAGDADQGQPAAVPAWVAQRRLIRVGYGDSEYVEVLDGIAEGDRIVTVGRSAVRDGTAIQVLEAVQ